jgi:putative transposase
VDVRLSNTLDLVAAEAFFRSAGTVTSVVFKRITAAVHDAYPRAIRNVFGGSASTSRYLNNHLEQDYRDVKQWYRSMGGFKPAATATRFCLSFDDIRALLRPQSQHNRWLSLQQRRVIHQERFAQLMKLMTAA